MLGIGYILTIAITIVDLLLFSYGGWILVTISILFILVFQGLMKKKWLNAYKCEERNENEKKLQLCALKLKNKVKSKHHYSPNIDICIIPGNDANSTLLDWKTIAVTEGALQMEPRVLEALIAHEYGHIMNGDVFLVNVAASNFFGLFFLLLINHFVIIAIIYLMVVLLFIIGVIRFNIISVFLSKWLTSFIRRACGAILRELISVSSIITRFFGKFGDYIADRYAVNLGYGLYLKRYLECYISEIPIRGAISPLQNRTTDVSKRIIKIDENMRRQ
jgi:hypothetical protein